MTRGNRQGREGAAARGLLVFVAKVTVSSALIWFLLTRMSFGEIRAAMAAPHWGWLGASLAVYALSAFGGAFQWAWILRAAGITTPVREIQRLYFIGLFFNNFLPANIGGDAYKIVDLGRREHRPLGVFCATLLDRLIGLGALAALATVTLAVASVLGIPLPTTALLMVPIVGVLFGVLCLLLSGRLGRRLPGLARRLGWERLGLRLEKITGEFALYRARAGWLGAIFLFSLGIQFLRMATHLLVALGLGFALTAEQAVQLLVLIPMLAVSLTLPITINGIGLRESVSANLLTWAGLAAGQAVAMEVAAYAVQVVFSLQGGILLWLGGWSRRQDKSGN